MATSRVVVHLADMHAIQQLVVAAAGVLDGIDVEWMRGHVPGPKDPLVACWRCGRVSAAHAETIPRAALVALLDALEALEART